jgi:hypothetical protein
MYFFSSSESSELLVNLSQLQHTQIIHIDSCFLEKKTYVNVFSFFKQAIVLMHVEFSKYSRFLRKSVHIQDLGDVFFYRS